MRYTWPWRTRSSNSERCVFASKAPIVLVFIQTSLLNWLIESSSADTRRPAFDIGDQKAASSPAAMGLRYGRFAELNEDDRDDGQGDAEPTAGADFLFPQDNTGYGQQADLARGNHRVHNEPG